MRKSIFLSFCIFVIIFQTGCNEKDTVAPNTEMIECTSTESYGCQDSKSLSKIESYANLAYEYSDGILTLFIDIEAQCAAIVSSDVSTTDNSIDINMWDTSSKNAKCSCLIRQVFTFNAEVPKTIVITVNYKSNTADQFIRILKGILEIK